MSIFTRVADALTGGLIRRDEQARAAGVLPPARTDAPVLMGDAIMLPAVQRALTILTTSAAQLGLDVERGGDRLEGADMPSIVRRPSLDMSRSEFIAQLVMSLAATGNAFIMREGGTLPSETTQLTPLSPHEVGVARDGRGRIIYSYDGRTYLGGAGSRIVHLRYLAMPGQLRGTGPIQAAQTTMRSARDMRRYASQWWETGYPSGVLSTDQTLSSADAKAYRDAWNGLDAMGDPIPTTENPSRVKVLGKGAHYEPLLISPKDALWIEAQSFDTLEIARIFGVPTSLMLTALDGNSMTYSNVEQEWLGFVRFSLMAYLRPIEEALTELTPRGQRVRFNLDALLRADTMTRYQAHEIGLRAGFLTVAEVREIEHLPALATPPAPAPALEPAPTDQQEIPA